jgi:hypothetical protein
MTANNHLIAIYDFEFFPYALGDVLTWNIRTAMRCEELKKEAVDVYICLDKCYPASIYQQGLINPDNFELFFSELYGAFGTNPKLGNIFIFRKREDLLAQLRVKMAMDPANIEAAKDYLNILNKRTTVNSLFTMLKSKIYSKVRIKQFLKRFTPKFIKETIYNNLSDEDVLNHYFIKYILSHEEINKFAAKKGFIPHLKPSLGCTPDIDELCERQLKGKKLVPFHVRLRRLDAGYGGDHSYARDSNFLEWYDFLRQANDKYPQVQFIALGRLQEKPLEILRLPNVTSLRIHGMGLGHELTLMLRSDLFIGSSSGFAALANFSQLPYFITRMNPGSCDAYAIPQGAEKLPFAQDNQKLIYETETSELLMSLLEKGLDLPLTLSLSHKGRGDFLVDPPSNGEGDTIDIHSWLDKRSQLINKAATTCRFYSDDNYRQNETAYLLLPFLEQALKDWPNEKDKTISMFNKLQTNFSVLCEKIPAYIQLKNLIESGHLDQVTS